MGYFFRSSVRNGFFSFVTEEFEISFLSLCILRHETFEFDIDDLSSMEDDPLCIHCMSWLIDEKA